MTDRDRLNALKAMDDAVIYAKDIAPIVHMKPETIIKKAKIGIWDQDRNGAFIQSGRCVKFNRADFVAKWSDRV